MNVTPVPPTSAVPRVGWCKRQADCYLMDVRRVKFFTFRYRVVW